MKPSLEIIIKESKVAELIKQKKAKYVHVQFKYVSHMWLNSIIYNGAGYFQKTLKKSDGKTGEFFIHGRTIPFVKDKIINKNIKIYNFNQ